MAFFIVDKNYINFAIIKLQRTGVRRHYQKVLSVWMLKWYGNALWLINLEISPNGVLWKSIPVATNSRNYTASVLNKICCKLWPVIICQHIWLCCHSQFTTLIFQNYPSNLVLVLIRPVYSGPCKSHWSNRSFPVKIRKVYSSKAK